MDQYSGHVEVIVQSGACVDLQRMGRRRSPALIPNVLAQVSMFAGPESQFMVEVRYTAAPYKIPSSAGLT